MYSREREGDLHRHVCNESVRDSITQVGVDDFGVHSNRDDLRSVHTYKYNSMCHHHRFTFKRGGASERLWREEPTMGPQLEMARRKLRAQLQQTGDVDELKARVRACVAKAMLVQSDFGEKEDGKEVEVEEKEEEEEEVKEVAELVEEWLRYCGMEHTRGVFAAERRAVSKKKKKNRKEHGDNCGTAASSSTPKILELLREKAPPQTSPNVTATTTPVSLDVTHKVAHLPPDGTDKCDAAIEGTTTTSLIEPVAEAPPAETVVPASLPPVSTASVQPVIDDDVKKDQDEEQKEEEEEEEEEYEDDLEEVSEDLAYSIPEEEEEEYYDNGGRLSSESSSASDAPSGVSLSDRSGPLDVAFNVDLVTEL